jgi:hypothetical protein
VLLTIRQLNSANPVGRLFCHDLHESGTAGYIIDLLSVPLHEDRLAFLISLL